jgi:SAM-dependent methyltransferase
MTDRVVCATAEYTLRDQELMRAAQRYFAWQARMARGELGRRIVEVGCGVGNFTRHLLDRDLVVATDAEAGCIAQLPGNVGQRVNVIARTIDVTDPEFVQLREVALDSVVCLNVLEHIRDDLQALSNMAAVVPPGGKVVLIVPAFEALYGPIDRNLGHYRRYSKKGLRKVASAAGFDVKKLRYMNLVGCIAWWINARVFKRTAQSESQIRMFDRWVVPALEWIETRIEPAFGQSIFAVLIRR